MEAPPKPRLSRPVAEAPRGHSKHCGVGSEAPRARIADIIRESGKMGTDVPGISQSQFAAIASAITGSAGTFYASQAISDELAKRFPKLSATGAMERDLDAPYATAGRALTLALQACGITINAAFDIESGAMLELKKPMSLIAPPFTVILTILDRGAATHVKGQSQHTGVDWGQNAKLLNQLFDKTGEYLNLFKS